MIINDLDDYYIVFDTKNRNIELDTLIFKSIFKSIFRFIQTFNAILAIFRSNFSNFARNCTRMRA